MGLGLDGGLEIRGSDGTVVRLRGAGAVVEIDIEERGGGGMFERFGQARRSLPIVRLIAATLNRLELSANVRVGKRRILSVGSDVQPDRLARILKLPHTRLR